MKSLPLSLMAGIHATKWIGATIVIVATSTLCLCQIRVPKYVIGIDILGPNASCPNGPVFISSVREISPAANAGILPGDQLLSVDGTPVKDFRDASHRITSQSPGPVSIELLRQGTIRKFTVPRERSDIVLSKNGLRMLDDGMLVELASTETDIEEIRKLNHDLESAMQAGDFLNVFPGHYPKDESLYYPGFEVFVWDKGEQVHVGGIEDSPARKNGVRWGDRIISVNGVDPARKSLAALESLFSSRTPTTMTITIERAGIQKTLKFPLALASDVLRDNNGR